MSSWGKISWRLAVAFTHKRLQKVDLVQLPPTSWRLAT